MFVAFLIYLATKVQAPNNDLKKSSSSTHTTLDTDKNKHEAKIYLANLIKRFMKLEPPLTSDYCEEQAEAEHAGSDNIYGEPKPNDWNLACIKKHQIVIYKLQNLYFTVSVLPPVKFSVETKENNEATVLSQKEANLGLDITLLDNKIANNQDLSVSDFRIPAASISEEDAKRIIDLLKNYPLITIDTHNRSCCCEFCI